MATSVDTKSSSNQQADDLLREYNARMEDQREVEKRQQLAGAGAKTPEDSFGPAAKPNKFSADEAEVAAKSVAKVQATPLSEHETIKVADLNKQRTIDQGRIPV